MDVFEQKIQKSDVLSFLDKGANADLPRNIAGIVDLKDDEGNFIFKARKNIVTLRGRTYCLESIFKDTIGNIGIDGSYNYISDLDRTVLAFTIGNGGAPSSDPFSPFAPTPNGINGNSLGNAIPFRKHDTTESGSGDPILYIPNNEINFYAGGIPTTATNTDYFYKKFDNEDPEWFFNSVDNTVYKKLILKISKDDCRYFNTNFVNELGLVIGRYGVNDSNGAATIINPELFSRITFSTEALPLNKSLTFEYRVYA